jgi:hypothetical protein
MALDMKQEMRRFIAGSEDLADLRAAFIEFLSSHPGPARLDEDLGELRVLFSELERDDISEEEFRSQLAFHLGIVQRVYAESNLTVRAAATTASCVFKMPSVSVVGRRASAGLA